MWKGVKAGSFLRFACLPSFPLASSSVLLLRHSFTGIRAYFFEVLAYTEDQLRHPALWTEQLTRLLAFLWGAAIVGLARPQPISHLKWASVQGVLSCYRGFCCRNGAIARKVQCLFHLWRCLKKRKSSCLSRIDLTPHLIGSDTQLSTCA